MTRIVVLAIAVVACANAASAQVLRLQDAIDEALARGPQLASAHDGVALAEIQRDLAGAAFGLKVHPTFSGLGGGDAGERSFGVGVSKRLQTGADVAFSAASWRFGLGDQQSRQTGYTVSISQPLLRGFGATATAGLDAARRAVSGAERQLEASRHQLALAVAAAYFGIVRQQRLVDAAHRALERATSLRAASDARARVGLATALDVLRADLLASQAEATLALQKEELAAARDRLALLAGRPIDASFDVAETDLPDGLPPLEPIGDLIARAIGARVELKEASDRVADAGRAANIAKWSLLPDLNLTASYSHRGIGLAGGGRFNDPFGGFRIGITSGYSLDRSAEMASAAGARITARAASRAAEQTARAVEAEVRAAYRACVRASDTITIQQKAADLAEKQLRLAQLRYERGLAGNFDVVDAESNLLQARSGLVAAQVDRALGRLALARATGTLNVREVFR